MKYSVVIPFLNEQESVLEVYDRLRASVEAISDDCEFVFIDDGSTDETFALLSKIAEIDSRVTVVSLSRNFGKTEALVAGFQHAVGEYLITMDGDLQHDPNDIQLFIDKLDQGYDIVCGWRVTRSGDSLVARRIPSKVANWMMAKLSGVPIHDFGGGFKAYRRELIRQLPVYGELQRFIPAIASHYGARICEIPIRVADRPHGRSHYGLGRLLPVFFDLITVRFLLRYLSRPMHFFGGIGMVVLAAGFSLAILLAFLRLVLHVHIMREHGPLLLLSTTLVLAGVQLVSIGLLGELNVRQSHKRLFDCWNLRVLTKRKTRMSS